jgi:hypothetical protein
MKSKKGRHIRRMRRRNLIALIITLTITTAVVGPYVYSRGNWYHIDDGWNGFSLLIACHAGTPLFSNVGFSLDAELVSERTARLDSWIACKAINQHQALLVSDTHWDMNNKALTMLVTHYQGCNDRRFTGNQIAKCKSAMADSIDWLLSNGVNVNPEGGCGYLRDIASTSLDVEMFAFLLSRGADPSIQCPRKDKPSTTVLEELELFLSWLDEGEFPDVEAAYLEMIEMTNQHLSGK